MSSVRRRSALRSRKIPHRFIRLRCGRTTLATTSCVSTNPSARRSRGADATPCAQALAGSRSIQGTPFSVTRPDRAREMSEPISRSGPAPARPTKPRISPSRSSNETSCNASLVRPWTDSATGPASFAGGAGPARRGSAAGHQFDQLRLAGFLGQQGGARLAVAQDTDPVADRQHFVETVRDVDDSAAAAAQHADEAKQALGFPPGQRRGRFVEHEDPRRMARVLDFQEGRGDLDQHAVADRKPPDADGRSDMIDAERRQRRARPGVEDAPVDQAEAAWVRSAEKDVLGDAHARHRVELLVNEAEPAPLRFVGSADRHDGPVEANFAVVRRHCAGEDLDQRALAGAVLAHQRVRLARPQFERRVGQRDRAAKRLAQVRDGEQAHRMRPERPGTLVPGRRDLSVYCLAFSWVISFVGT